MAIIFHPSRMTTKESRFQSHDWRDFYGDGVEELPSDMPKPLGESIKITAFIDSNHAGNLLTQRSQTGYIIFCNQSPILWYSRCQNTVEASTFGAEFVAARTCLGAIESLRFKLRMFRIPVEGPADVLCDNNGVVNNIQKPDSVLGKRHLSICYHHVHEAVALLVARVGKIESSRNLADLFTKCLPTSTRHYLLGGMVHMGTTGLCAVAKNDSHLNRAFERPG